MSPESGTLVTVPLDIEKSSTGPSPRSSRGQGRRGRGGRKRDNGGLLWMGGQMMGGEGLPETGMALSGIIGFIACSRKRDF